MGEIYFSKRGQLAIFVIFGVLIVVGIIALFMALPPPNILDDSSPKDPMQEIKPCIANSLEEVLPNYLETGFYANPLQYVHYETKNIAYHCFTLAKRQICSRNDAQSKLRIETELKNNISGKVESCFDKFKIANPALDIKIGPTELAIEILPGKINIRTKKNLAISKNEELPREYDRFDVSINSPLWDFIILSNEIINQEVSCDCPKESCTADLVEMMRNNRDYKITVFIGSRDEKVYTIENFLTGEKLNFGVKNCDKTP
jgi:hypothetical protein